MKQQVALAHTIRQTETPAVLDSWVTNKTAVEILCPQKKMYSNLDFRGKFHTLKYWSVKNRPNVFMSPLTL